MLSTFDKAFRYATAYGLGEWVAEVVVEPGAPIEIRRESASGRVDVFGSAQDIADRVISYHRAQRVE